MEREEAQCPYEGLCEYKGTGVCYDCSFFRFDGRGEDCFAKKQQSITLTIAR